MIIINVFEKEGEIMIFLEKKYDEKTSYRFLCNNIYRNNVVFGDYNSVIKPILAEGWKCKKSIGMENNPELWFVNNLIM